MIAATRIESLEDSPAGCRVMKGAAATLRVEVAARRAKLQIYAARADARNDTVAWRTQMIVRLEKIAEEFESRVRKAESSGNEVC